MRLEAQLQSTLARDFAQMGTSLREAADQAVKSTTEDVLRKGRAEVAQGISSRASNLLTSRNYVQPDQVGAGYFYNRGWWRDRQDILAAYETGASIRPKSGEYLVQPLKAALRYGVVGGARRRLTPATWKAATGLDLRPVRQRDGSILLFARQLKGAEAQNFRLNKAGRLVRSRAKKLKPVPEVPIFRLTKDEVRVPKRINLDPVREYAGTRLAEQLIINFERRGITT